MPDLEPITRLEEYLSKLAGDDVAVPEPITRVEKFLAYIAGEADSKPTPITRIEKFLDAIGQGGGGGGGETVIVPEQSLTVEEEDGIYYAMISVAAVPEVGDECTITLNGTDYTITATIVDDRVVLGDYGEGGVPDFTNYPFAITFNGVGGEDSWIDLESDGTYTVKVTKQGGASAVIIEKNITANGTYNASSDSADGYNPVNVSVPNSYSAGDEGKVVSSGALVSQTAATYTANSVYDTTLIDEVTVNVSGGGGGLTLLHTEDVAVNTTSTTAETVKTINVPTAWVADKIILVVIKDKAGARSGYSYGSTRFVLNTSAENGATGAMSFVGQSVYYDSNNKAQTTSSYGVYANQLSSNGNITIIARYSSSYGTIDGTYEIKVYAVDIDPFA